MQAAILRGVAGSIAVTLAHFDGAVQQAQVVGWSLINSVASAQAFATAVGATGRAFPGGATAIGDALIFTAGLFGGNGFEAPRGVIDISGDGATNQGTASSTGRGIALANPEVDTINGLVIQPTAGLVNHYQTQVIGGPGNFLVIANNFTDFGDAIKNKIIAEVTPPTVPEPSALLLLGSGLTPGSAPRSSRTSAGGKRRG